MGYIEEQNIKTMDAIAVIPARYDSSRFPGKPLVQIAGKSMLQRVYKQVKKYKGIDRIIIATDDERIYKHAIDFADLVFMTSKYHQSGTERCAEVVEILQKNGYQAPRVVINVQGDEPFIHPEQIGLVHHCFDEADVEIATLVKVIEDEATLFDPNVVKAVIGQKQQALYFSRSPIPFLRGVRKQHWLKEHTFYKHIGLYGYHANVLKKIVKLKMGALERAESLEQLRWLQNGFEIQTMVTERESLSIDTPEDLERLPI